MDKERESEAKTMVSESGVSGRRQCYSGTVKKPFLFLLYYF